MYHKLGIFCPNPADKLPRPGQSRGASEKTATTKRTIMLLLQGKNRPACLPHGQVAGDQGAVAPGFRARSLPQGRSYPGDSLQNQLRFHLVLRRTHAFRDGGERGDARPKTNGGGSTCSVRRMYGFAAGTGRFISFSKQSVHMHFRAGGGRVRNTQTPRKAIPLFAMPLVCDEHEQKTTQTHSKQGLSVQYRSISPTSRLKLTH